METGMIRFASYISIALAYSGSAMAGTAVVSVPAIGSPLPVIVAIGAVALAIRVLRRA
jgi:hypothetical protein